MPKKGPKPDYGIDAPDLVRLFFMSGVSAFVIFILLYLNLDTQFYWRGLLLSVFAIIALYLIGMGCLMIYESKVKKIYERNTILDRLKLRGSEYILDVGCGRGLMLIGAAKRLVTGKAIGVDIWQSKDQSKNTMEATLSNAQMECVADKIDVKTADMRSLPFEDASFDIVVSHWVVHNLEKDLDRKKALSEMVRVLRSGGTLALTDISNRREYLTELTALGLLNIYAVSSSLRDVILGGLSFGSFRPATIFALKPNDLGK